MVPNGVAGIPSNTRDFRTVKRLVAERLEDVGLGRRQTRIEWNEELVKLAADRGNFTFKARKAVGSVGAHSITPSRATPESKSRDTGRDLPRGANAPTFSVYPTTQSRQPAAKIG